MKELWNDYMGNLKRWQDSSDGWVSTMNKSKETKEEYKKKADELRKQVIAYQNKRKSSFDKIAKLRTEARQNLLKKLNPILKSYIEENMITAVLDKKNIIIGNTDDDITKVITEKLNKELPSLNLN